MAFKKLHPFQEIAFGSWRKLTNLLMVSDVIIITIDVIVKVKVVRSCLDNC